MRRGTVLLALVALARPGTAGAQKGGDTWQFSNLQQGYCITFLVSPDDAPGVLPEDAQPVRLDAMSDASPVLARVLADQPEVGSWMPAAACVYRFGRAEISGRELVPSAGASEMIGIISYGARVAINQPPNGVSVSTVFTNDKRAVKLTDSTQVALRQVKAIFGKADRSDDERHVLQLGKTTLTWDGHPASDSVPLTAPLERVWVVRGPRGKPVLLRWKLSASTSRSMVGALVVEGKDKLAKLMRKSPSRYLGPMYQGGIGELTVMPD